MNRFALLILYSYSIFSCTTKESFEVTDFRALTNFSSANSNIKTISLDYNGSFENGFIIPTINQAKDGFFECTYQIKNNTTNDKQFFYKIYYQNESYKFSDDHPYSYENFYGSWEDVNVSFAETPIIKPDGNFHEVSTKFRIVGNPRNEKKYFGSNNIGPISKKETDDIIFSIKNTPEWIKVIIDKAKQNNFTIDKQLFLDALYIAKQKREEGDFNNRWKRNPRVGEYKFMLVVVSDSSDLKEIPKFIQNISLLDSSNQFVNPFSFFSKPSINHNIRVYASNDILKVVAKPNIGSGVYINSSSFSNPKYDTSYCNDLCNSSNDLLLNASFEQFVSSYNPGFKFKNVPIVADVNGGEYTKKNYYESLNKPHNFISVPIEVAQCPCKNINYNSNKSIIIKNPATKQGEWRKENIGIISRHGFTYGKYRVKAKLPELLNKDNVWNGLTNAIWLIYQQGNWNTRRTCFKNGGYVPKSYPGEGVITYVPTDVYSEIDIEIVKASRNWPLSSYGGDVSKKPKDDVSDSNKVMVTYTNWDLACQDPEKFNRGLFNVNYKNVNYQLHRWDNWYQAVTGKYPVLDDEIFAGSYYWFEIEWKPEEIIWRIGPEKDKLREIGYVNSTVSSIPNNQMLLIITQEWHLENWWPEAPFNQNYIPFPAKEIKGEILEVEIE